MDFFTLPFRIDFAITEILLIIVTIGMIILCIGLILSSNLLESVILMSAFSILITICYLLLDAADVAMTEAALGVAISTCVLLNILKKCNIDIEFKNEFDTKILSNITLNQIFSFILSIVFLVVFIWAGIEMPLFGDEDVAINTHITNMYLENTPKDINIPSFVAAILASYRGYDTLGETTVILIAGLSVLIILARKIPNKPKK